MGSSEPRLTERIIGAAMKVHNDLGVGFLEKVCENALCYELKKLGLKVEQQKPLQVFYDGIVVGDYIADLIVEDKVMLEFKVAKALADHHTAICLNYLRASNLPVCLLLNFGIPRLQFKRIVGDAYASEKIPI